MKNLLPLTELNLSTPLNIRYLPGSPRSYRLDLRQGVLNLEGREQVTMPGASFDLIPIAFRYLEDELFGQAFKKWCEVYFINQQGQVGVFMFHGYSVQNLSDAARELFYDNRSLCEVRWTVHLRRKINKDGQSYYMAFFEFKPLSALALEQHQSYIQEIKKNNFHIYRADTMRAKTLFSEHYSTHLEPSKAEIEQEATLRASLLKAFGEPDIERAA